MATQPDQEADENVGQAPSAFDIFSGSTVSIRAEGKGPKSHVLEVLDLRVLPAARSPTIQAGRPSHDEPEGGIQGAIDRGEHATVSAQLSNASVVAPRAAEEALCVSLCRPSPAPAEAAKVPINCGNTTLPMVCRSDIAGHIARHAMAETNAPAASAEAQHSSVHLTGPRLLRSTVPVRSLPSRTVAVPPASTSAFSGIFDMDATGMRLGMSLL